MKIIAQRFVYEDNHHLIIWEMPIIQHKFKKIEYKGSIPIS